MAARLTEWKVRLIAVLRSWRPSASRFLRSWQAPAAAGLLLLIAMVYWLAPRPVERVVPVDESTSWTEDEAPPRREIVWRPPREIPALFADDDARAELVAPKLANDGTTLLFSRRIDGRQSDLYQSRLKDGRWRPAEPLTELNTASNEVGPVLTSDGRQLYFYSDRPGGLGGTDIYVSSRREGGGWSEPRNLGSKVNSAAHEFDPAPSPDGLSLYFASNRTPETARRIADDEAARQEWKVTLRARLDLTRFDLYRARRDRSDSEWGPSAALDLLNRPDSSEGAPTMSPNGAFLYFASDRPARKGEHPNLDLYRARLAGERFGKPENLGPGVNTAAHETEPGLSAEGFTLVFSSDRDGVDRLYASTATEIFYETQWQASPLNAFHVPWWWWLPVTFLLLAAALLAVLYYRNWLLVKVWPARFFLGGVLLNLLVILLLAVWTLPQVFDAIVAEFQEVVPAPDFVDDNQHQSHEDGRQSHEKVADLKSIDPAPLPQVVRKVTSPLSVPERTERLVPTIPLEQARALPQERVVFVPPKPQVDAVKIPAEPQRLPRSRPRRSAAALDEAALSHQRLELAAVESPQEADVNEINSEIVRDQAAQATPATPRNLNPLTPARPVAASINDVKPAADVPVRPDDGRPSPLTRKPARRPADVLASVAAPSVDVSSEAVPTEPPVGAKTPPLDRTQAAVDQPKQLSKPRLDLPPSSVVRAGSADPADATRERQDLLPAKVDSKMDATTPASPPLPIARRVPGSRSIVASNEASDDQPVELTAAERPGEVSPMKVDLAVARTARPQLDAPVPTPQELTGPVTRFKHRVVVGELSKQSNEAPPAFSPLANRLDRRRARATRVALAEDNVGLKTLFTLRQGETRRKYIKLLGGTDESEKAVNLGLEWLAKNQEEDGSWDLRKHGGQTKSNTAGTGLGLLPFLAAGYTHQKPGKYQKNVAAALGRLLEHQKANGDLLGSGDAQHMYSHGIAAIALCEAYGMSGDEELKDAARKSLDFIVAAQHKPSGGWRYTPNQPADTSVVGWQMMALKSGEMAGLSVAQPVYDHVDRWLKSVEGRNDRIGTFGYSNRSGTPAMTAEGLLCLQFMKSTGRNAPRMRSGAAYLLANLPDRNQKGTSYYWYYGTQVMYHMQGEYWEAWNERLRDMLVETQIKTGPQAGTWQPRDRWEASGGRVYATSLKLLMLEVYYRHLPLYEQLEK